MTKTPEDEWINLVREMVDIGDFKTSQPDNDVTVSWERWLQMDSLARSLARRLREAEAMRDSAKERVEELFSYGDKTMHTAIRKLSAALSRIDYLCGEPNDQQVSGYDVHCNEDEVVKRVAELTERHRMQLAAIGVMATCNTRETANFHRIGRDNPYWTPALERVCIAVDREMEERERADAAEMRYIAWG